MVNMPLTEKSASSRVAVELRNLNPRLGACGKLAARHQWIRSNAYGSSRCGRVPWALGRRIGESI